MTTRKTAVSIDEELFARADLLARDMGVTRSGLYSRALEQYLRQKEDAALLVEIDEAYSNPDTPAERRKRSLTKSYRARLAEGEW